MRQPTDASFSLPAFAVALLTSMVIAAVGTTAILIAVDRIDRPVVALVASTEPTIVVHVDGAVATPGVYMLPSGARLHDAVTAAGGLTDGADRSKLNLAGRVGDGEQVTIDTLEPVPLVEATDEADAGPVNINTATVDELDTLPGIGPVIGERIVTYREEHGPFDTIEQLAEVAGISESLVETLRPHVTVDD
jgi:competence protein ComEA